MRLADAMRSLAELSTAQWGLFTTAQAAVSGVDRVTLTRLNAADHIERLTHGVYRDVGAPEDRFAALRAAWLSIDPKLLAEQRVAAGPEVATPVSGTAAAELHGVGDLRVEVFEFTSPVRRQSQRAGMRYRIRNLDSTDVSVRSGLPVTTLERTIVDLVVAGHDLDNVAQVVRDASRRRALDESRLVDLLGPFAARLGFASGDGAALWSRLTVLAGIDVASAVEALANDDVLGSAVAHKYAAKLEAAARAARKLEPSLSQQAAAEAIARRERLLEHSAVAQLARQAAARQADLDRMQKILRTPAVEAAMRAARRGW